MLSELYQASCALQNRGVPATEIQRDIEPMGRAELVTIRLDERAHAQTIEVWAPGEAAKLLRVAHGSKGSYFPGFNLPCPLRELSQKVGTQRLTRVIDAQRDRTASQGDILSAGAELLSDSEAGVFDSKEIGDFRRSVQELVEWLRDDLKNAPAELANFRQLLDIVARAKLELAAFAESLVPSLCHAAPELNRKQAQLFVQALFGKTYLPKIAEPVGSAAYWRAKAIADEKLKKLPIYLDLASEDSNVYRVADWRTGRLLNDFLLKADLPPYNSEARKSRDNSRREQQPESPAATIRDALTGEEGVQATDFPEPKLAVLGNTKLFANNTTEAECFFRYGLGDSNTFKTTAGRVRELSAALFTLAGDDLALPALGGKVATGRTCREMPSQRKGMRQLLVAYLEHEPDAVDPWVELFGAQASDASTSDYGESTKKVLAALDGKALANPNELVRLIAIAQLDNANKQVSLNRSFTVGQVKQAVDAWRGAATNCPPVTLPFWSKKDNRTIERERTVPGPLDVASVLNQVWAANSKGGCTASFQRSISGSDAFDLFIGLEPFRMPKTRAALATLLSRMRPVFTRAGALKVTRNFRERDSLYKLKPLSEEARWQVLKAVSLAGIFLYQLNQHHEAFMRESIYQVGRLLALADSLHFQYCKWVRTSDGKRDKGKVDAPSELLGNSLFNFALDNPVAALARLAERIRPYKGWADTYTGQGAGLVHWFERQLAECERQLDLANLPSRMEDIHKAQLLLGYLGDHPKSEAKDD